MSLVNVNTGEKLSIQHIHVSVEICADFSRTSLHVAFFNQYNAIVNEAEFTVVLTESATVSGYAKDIGGYLVDAVVVPKEKARAVFASETRSHSKHKTSVVGMCC